MRSGPGILFDAHRRPAVVAAPRPVPTPAPSPYDDPYNRPYQGGGY
ncbi:DUF6643 family protein [Streptomyces lavendulocolor]